MTLHRIIPHLGVADAGAGHDFSEEFLGLRKEFDLGVGVAATGRHG